MTLDSFFANSFLSLQAVWAGGGVALYRLKVIHRFFQLALTQVVVLKLIEHNYAPFYMDERLDVMESAMP